MTKPTTPKHTPTTPAKPINPDAAWDHLDTAKNAAEKLDAVLSMLMVYCEDHDRIGFARPTLDMAICEVMDLSAEVHSGVIRAHEALGGDQ